RLWSETAAADPYRRSGSTPLHPTPKCRSKPQRPPLGHLQKTQYVDVYCQMSSSGTYAELDPCQPLGSTLVRPTPKYRYLLRSHSFHPQKALQVCAHHRTPWRDRAVGLGQCLASVSRAIVP